MDKSQRQAETKKRIYEYLREGLFKKHAAISAGISEKTFYRWLEEDQEFARLVDKSIAEYHQFLIQVLNRGIVKNPRIAFKILALRFPEEWDPKRVARHLQYEEKPSGDTKKIADELQALLKEGHVIEERER